MRLILLPGLDGTGEIYTSFIQELSGDIQVTIIPYPQETNLDYVELLEYVSCRLPKNEKFIILAESFSGPIGYQLAKAPPQNLIAIIFVATFIKNPNRFLMSLVRLLPLTLLLRLPIPDFIVKHWLFGSNVTESMLVQFKKILHCLPASVIKFRLALIRDLCPDNDKITLPVIYIQALKDSLVLKDNYMDFQHRCPCFTHVVVDGPHFLLQSRPGECANIVMEQVGKIAGVEDRINEN